MNKIISLLFFSACILAGCKKDNAHRQQHPLNSGITTTPADSITAVSAVSGGTIDSSIGLPVILKGICIDTSPNPSVMSNVDPFYQQINSGSGFGTFSVSISGLVANTTYHIRAWASVDSNGQSVTKYGNDVSFTTPSYTYAIGLSLPRTSTHRSGIIFYIDSTGQHGLLCGGVVYNGCLGCCYNSTLTNCTASALYQVPGLGYSIPTVAQAELLYTNLGSTGYNGFGPETWTYPDINPPFNDTIWVVNPETGAKNWYNSASGCVDHRNTIGICSF